MPMESWVGGQPQGLGIDYVRLLSERAGLQLEFHPYTDWAAVAFDQVPVPYDLLPAQPATRGRLERFHLLRPFMSGTPALVTRKGDETFRDGRDLAHARIVTERRFRQGARRIAARFPEATLLYADDGHEALEMVAQGEADAYIGITAARTRLLLSRRPQDDLTLVGPAPLEVVGIGPAVNRADATLAAILRKAEATVTDAELVRLRQRWAANEDTPAMMIGAALGARERSWLRTLPELRLGYEVDRFPYSFVDREGEFSGLAADYIRTIEQQLGLRIRLVPVPDWKTLQTLVRAHEIDLVAAGTSRDFGLSEMVFSQPYEYFPEVIVTRLKGPPIAGPRDLASRRIAFRMESGLYSQLRMQYGARGLRPVGSNEAGLAMVDRGEADAFVGTLPAIDALIRNRYAGDLRIVGPAGMDQEFAIGVRPDFAPLLPMIDQVLTGLDSDERQVMRSRWITTEYRYGVPWAWVLGGLAAAALVLGTIAIAYVRLRRTSHALETTERALAAQLGFQQALLENVPYPVFVKDSQGRYVAVNHAYEDLLGCRREDLVGRTLAEVRHLRIAVDIDALHADNLETLESGAHFRREYQFDGTDGESRSLILWMRPFADAATGQRSLLGTAVDISDVRAAEARARTSEQKLSEFTRAIPGAVFQVSVAADGTRRFTYMAGNVESLLGATPEQILDDESALFARLHPDDQPVVIRNVEHVLATMESMAAFDVRLRVGDAWRWLRTEGGQPRRASDDGVEWSGYFIDTTEQHEQAAALQAAKEQAESATAAKSAFLAAMSHEIRTPMADVIALIELLARSRMDREQADMLGMVQASARAMLQVLDDILDYSRIDSGRLRFEHTRFDLREVIDNLAGVFAARAATKDLVLRSVVDWRLAVAFHGDPFRIRQIVSNLMSNAIKFTDEGSVMLHVELVEDSGSGQTLRFNVVDTGIGIDPDGLARLFKPFTQAEESTTRRFGGTGLGLSISRHLASMMAGNVRLESRPGAGTRAILELPLEVAERGSAPPEFAGKLAALACIDDAREEELSNALSALGFRVMELDRDDLEDMSEDIDLLVADPARPITLRHPPGACLLADDHPSRRAVRREGTCVVVPTAPLLWRNLQEACHAAFGTAPSAVVVAEERSVVQQRARILVAEDHITNRAVMARQLEALGYRHTIVEDGEQALEALDRAPYDALITDCHMPNLDGYELARRIRAREGGARRLLIVGISASAQPEQMTRCQEAGMDDFLTKPVQLDDLAAMLVRHIGNDARRSSSLPNPNDALAKDALASLRTVFLDPHELRAFLHDLLDACRSDLERLDHLRAGDEAAQRDLLHRIEGALAVLGPPDEHLGDESVGVAARRTRALARLEWLEAAIRELELTAARDDKRTHAP